MSSRNRKTKAGPGPKDGWKAGNLPSEAGVAEDQREGKVGGGGGKKKKMNDVPVNTLSSFSSLLFLGRVRALPLGITMTNLLSFLMWTCGLIMA